MWWMKIQLSLWTDADKPHAIELTGRDMTKLLLIFPLIEFLPITISFNSL